MSCASLDFYHRVRFLVIVRPRRYEPATLMWKSWTAVCYVCKLPDQRAETKTFRRWYTVGLISRISVLNGVYPEIENLELSIHTIKALMAPHNINLLGRHGCQTE